MQHPPHELDKTLLFGCASLLDQVDKKVLVLLRDKRTLIGILRTCDQFNNLVLHESVERICVGKKYGDIERGLFIVRGDNVVLVGEIDPAKEGAPNLTKVPIEVILDAQRLEQEERVVKEEKRIKAFKERGMLYQNDQLGGDDG